MLLCNFRKFDFSNSKMTFANCFMKELPIFIADFQSFYKVLLFDIIILCGNSRQYTRGPLNIFHVLQESQISLLIIIISAAFYDTTEILKWVIARF